MDKHFVISYGDRRLSFPGNSPVHIGQTEGCDVRLPNTSQYIDVAFAKIAANRNSEGWHLVRLTDYYPIMVGGVDLNRVHYLKDGDVIEVTGQTLRFNVLDGVQEAPAVTHIHKGGGTIWAVVAVILIALGLISYHIYDDGKEKLTGGMIAEIETSMFTTRVDSLYLMCGDSIADRYIYMSSPVGTAFLTTDSLIVTARHCLQPWLNMVLPLEYATIPERSEWPLASALKAETENQLSGDDKWRVISFVTLTDNSGNQMSLSSEDFKINTEFDDIVELDSNDYTQFWRSITHRHSRISMMLGDIAMAHCKLPGKIELASRSDILRLLARQGAELYFFGHPATSVLGNKPDRRIDELRTPLQLLDEDSTHISILAHDGSLTRGFSGGPVIVRDGHGFKAVGVISVYDESNKTRSYSVPTSEVEYIKLFEE